MWECWCLQSTFHEKSIVIFCMWRNWHPEMWSTLGKVPCRSNGGIKNPTFLCPNWVCYRLDHAGFNSTVNLATDSIKHLIFHPVIWSWSIIFLLQQRNNFSPFLSPFPELTENKLFVKYKTVTGTDSYIIQQNEWISCKQNNIKIINK